MPLFDYTQHKDLHEIKNLLNKKLFFTTECLFYDVGDINPKLKNGLQFILIQLKSGQSLLNLKSSTVFNVYSVSTEDKKNIYDTDFPEFLVLIVKDTVGEVYAGLKNYAVVIFPRNHKVLPRNFSEVSPLETLNFSLKTAKDFIIPDLCELYKFCMDIDSNGCTSYLSGVQSHVRGSQHVATVLNFIYGKRRHFLRLDPMIEGQTPIFFNNFGFKNIPYKRFLACLLQRYNLNKHEIHFDSSPIINKAMVSSFKKILERIVVNQFDDGFCSYKTTISDFPRFFFKRVIVNGAVIIDVINKDVDDFSRPEKIQMVSNDIKKNLTHLKKENFPFAFNFMRANFIPALLILSMNQGAMVSFLHLLQSVFSVHLNEKLSPSIVLDIKNTVVKPHCISCSISGELFDIPKNDITLEYDFKISFDYVISAKEKTIHIESCHVEMNSFLETILSGVKPNELPSLDESDLTLNVSTLNHWNRISKVAEWIQLGHLSLPMLRYFGSYRGYSKIIYTSSPKIFH